jgi:hypothetical protein
MVEIVEKITEKPVELDGPKRSDGEVQFTELDEMGKVLLVAGSVEHTRMAEGSVRQRPLTWLLVSLLVTVLTVRGLSA